MIWAAFARNSGSACHKRRTCLIWLQSVQVTHLWVIWHMCSRLDDGNRNSNGKCRLDWESPKQTFTWHISPYTPAKTTSTGSLCLQVSIEFGLVHFVAAFFCSYLVIMSPGDVFQSSMHVSIQSFKSF